MRLDLDIDAAKTVPTIRGLPENVPPPASLIATELVFLVHLARLATRERIVPQAVHTTVAIPQAEAYAAFCDAPISLDTFNGLAFRAEDARKPFLTANEKMWAVFEPELARRMADLDPRPAFRDRVRACLVEILASGQCTMGDVAQRLAVSNRTLQRRLTEEGTSFQNELNALREELARHYLNSSAYSSAEIAFLLG